MTTWETEEDFRAYAKAHTARQHSATTKASATPKLEPSPPSTPSTRTIGVRWEYKIHSAPWLKSSIEDIGSLLNEWGQQGWELVSDHDWLIFKRPV